jgi:hypothetical protein
MRKKILVFNLMLISFLVSGREETYNINQIRQNSVYFEFFGTGAYTISLNYERIFKGFNNFGMRAGFGYLPPSGIYDNNRRYCSIPLELIWLIFKGQHHLELGAGISIISDESKDAHDIHLDYILYVPRIGYRYNGKKGLMVRAGFTPVIDPSRNLYTNRFPLNPYGGVSIGYSF